MIDGIMLGLGIGSLVFLVISIILLFSLRKLEITNVINLFLAGLILMAVVSIFDILVFSEKVFGFGMDVNFLMNIVSIFIVPLIALCFLAALFVLKDS